jgi:hypothetical protein
MRRQNRKRIRFFVQIFLCRIGIHWWGPESLSSEDGISQYRFADGWYRFNRSCRACAIGEWESVFGDKRLK